jgi:hypothetical protein
VSQSVLECHGGVVKTVVKTDALRFASVGASANALQREAADRMELVLTATQ